MPRRPSSEFNHCTQAKKGAALAAPSETGSHQSLNHPGDCDGLLRRCRLPQRASKTAKTGAFPNYLTRHWITSFRLLNTSLSMSHFRNFIKPCLCQCRSPIMTGLSKWRDHLSSGMRVRADVIVTRLDRKQSAVSGNLGPPR